MEETVIDNTIAVENDVASHSPVTTSSMVSIRNIFKDAAASRKVIVIQSPGLSEKKDELSYMMDAVDQPNDRASEPKAQFSSDTSFEANNHSTESIETVSAIECPDDGTGPLNVPLNSSDKLIDENGFAVEPVSEFHAAVGSDSRQLIYINSDETKEEVQFIDVSGTDIVTDIPASTTAPGPVMSVETLDLSVEQLQKTHSSGKATPCVSKEDSERTRFLCPVCQKSFRQRHLLLCHIKLHDAKPKNTSIYMSNCTSCGGNVRLTSEQARLLQERGTEDARIICSTCKLLGHEVMQQEPNVPIELKPALSFNCDMCACDIKLTEDQLQLVERKGAENIRIICAPCSVKDQELLTENVTNSGSVDAVELKCNVCHRPIELQGDQDLINYNNPICADCQTKYEEEMAVENINTNDNIFAFNCSFCLKEMYLTEQPKRGLVICDDCKTKQKHDKSRRVFNVKEEKEFSRDTTKSVEGLAVMYKCNNCFCSMQLSAEQRELLKSRGVSGTKIICASCHLKETNRPRNFKKQKNFRTYQCDICLSDMDSNFQPKEDDDIICATCKKIEEKERFKKHKDKLLSINKCCTCHRSVTLTSAQLKRIQEQGERTRLSCDTCKRTSEEEILRTQKLIKCEDGVDYRCDICSLSFGSSFDEFSNHFSKVHVPESDAENIRGDVEDGKSLKSVAIFCPICDSSFKDRTSLKTHLDSHKPELDIGKNLRKKSCPLCAEFHTKIAMFEHYRSVHNIGMEKVSYDFNNVEEFKLWKEEVEKSTHSKFISSAHRAKAIKDNRGVLVSLKCHYNCNFKKERNKKKLGVYCPAKMTVLEKLDGNYHVDFIGTHLGHGDLSNFSEEEKSKIFQMLKANQTVEDIILELCKGIEADSSDIIRISQLKSVDLCAIKSFMLNACKDESDECYSSESEGEGVPVELPDSLSWVKEISMVDDDIGGDESFKREISLRLSALGDNKQLKLENPSNLESCPLIRKKLEVLHRILGVLNKCTLDEHFEILDVYMNPCEQTLNELSSGKRVEVVEDDTNFENSEEPSLNHDGTCDPPSKRPKIDEDTETVSIV